MHEASQVEDAFLSEESALPSRRSFLKRAMGSMALIGAGTFSYTWRIEPHWVEIVRRDLPIANLPASLAGRTLAHISDLHIGPVVDDAYMRSALRRVSSLDPDIIAITGDIMTCRGSEHVEHAAEILTSLGSAPLGTFAVLGNHDYGSGWAQRDVADRLTARMDKLNITTLRNERADVGGLTITGVDDLWGPRFAGADRTLASLDSANPNLVLCHNPDAADRNVWGDFRGWILSGHTHGGQCCAPFLGPPILPVQNRRYIAGEIDLYDGRRLYINRGLGYLRRVRFNARPEITLFTLRAA